MNPRQARRERREAERKAKKLALKKTLAGDAHPLSHNQAASPETQPQRKPDLQAHFPSPETMRRAAEKEIGFVSQNTPSRAEINRANAQFSTGPRSTTGKLASSRNSLKHGLASGQLIIPGEDPAEFEALLNDLLSEHQPATPTEQLLIQEMAQSYWLRQRAIGLQNACFSDEGVNEKQLALFLRYQTTHERNFHKALDTLLRLKKEAARAQSGFVSQRRNTPDRFVSQTATHDGFVSQNAPEPQPSEGVPLRQPAA